MYKHDTKISGFTLVEIVIVVVLIGILAAVAIPRFADFQRDAKISAVRAFLGAIRTAIENYKAQAIVDTGFERYPAYAEVYNISTGESQIMQTGSIPANPFTTSGKFGSTPNYVYQATTEPKGTLVGGGMQGWCYRESESSPGAGDAGQFWANTNTPGVGENNF